MQSKQMWVGADPGGINRFGMVILDEDDRYESLTVSCAQEAISMLDGRPAGVGIDAPLWWSSGRSSNRHADQWISNRYRRVIGSSVVRINSLRGACLVQGVMFALEARKLFGDIGITEAHPKAVLRALDSGLTLDGSWELVCERFGLVPMNSEAENSHERDAVLCAPEKVSWVAGPMT